MSKNPLFLSGEEEGHLLPVPAKIGRRPFPRSSVILFTRDRTNKRMTGNDHITSALLAEVIIIIIIIIIICYRPSDRVKIDRQDIFN